MQPKEKYKVCAVDSFGLNINKLTANIPHWVRQSSESDSYIKRTSMLVVDFACLHLRIQESFSACPATWLLKIPISAHSSR